MSNQYDELYQIIYLMILIGYFQSVFYLYRFCMATKRIKLVQAETLVIEQNIQREIERAE